MLDDRHGAVMVGAPTSVSGLLNAQKSFKNRIKTRVSGLLYCVEIICKEKLGSTAKTLQMRDKIVQTDRAFRKSIDPARRFLLAFWRHFLPFSSSAGLTGSNKRKVDKGQQAMECGQIREVQLGRTRYIVHSHYRGTDTFREKLR